MFITLITIITISKSFTKLKLAALGMIHDDSRVWSR